MTDPEKIPTKADKAPPEEVKLNDTTFRLIGIPFFGIAIPNLTGLFGTIATS